MSNPAKTPEAARDRYTADMQQILSCISRTVWYVGPSPYGSSLGLTPQEFPVAFRPANGISLVLRPSHSFHTLETDDGWKVKTDAYSYHVLARPTGSREDYEELIAWHWHPHSRPDPHFHVDSPGFGSDFDRTHVPTGRVTFESIVRFLVRELGIRALRTDWKSILTETEARHKEFRTWS